MATQFRRSFPSLDQQREHFPIDMIAHYDDHRFIYNGNKYSYPQNVDSGPLRQNFLKEMARMRNHYSRHQLISARDKEVRKKMLEDITKFTPEEKFNEFVVIIRNIALAFMSMIAIKYGPRL